MQVLEGEQGARDVELGAGLVAPHVALVVRGVELSSQRQLQEQVEVLGASKTARHLLMAIESDRKGDRKQGLAVGKPWKNCRKSLKRLP